MEEGTPFWMNHLVGTFLDANISYHVVSYHHMHFKLKRSVKVKNNKTAFLFKFFDLDEGRQILKVDLIILKCKNFIIHLTESVSWFDP